MPEALVPDSLDRLHCRETQYMPRQGDLRTVLETMDQIRSEFERCTRLGQPYPSWHDLDRFLPSGPPPNLGKGGD
jgi:hypothetical protein